MAMLARADVARHPAQTEHDRASNASRRAVALIGAARVGDDQEVEALLAEGVSVESVDESFQATPLLWASRSGHASTISLLMEHRADLDARDKFGSTALHAAPSRVVAQLLALRAPLEARDQKGRTPLFLAARYARVQAVHLMLHHRANIEARDKEGCSPLHRSSGKVCPVLLEHRADIEARDRLGETPLHTAAAEGRLGSVGALLGLGAAIEAEDRDERTPLHVARGDSARLLLQHNADMNARDWDRRAPLHWAAWLGHMGAVRSLLEFGANPLSHDVSLFLPRDYAINRGHRNIAAILPKQGWKEMVRTPGFPPMAALVCISMLLAALVPWRHIKALKAFFHTDVAGNAASDDGEGPPVRSRPSTGAVRMAMRASAPSGLQELARAFRIFDAFVNCVLPMWVMMHIRPLLFLPFFVLAHAVPIWLGLGLPIAQNDLASFFSSIPHSLYLVGRPNRRVVLGLGISACRVAFYLGLLHNFSQVPFHSQDRSWFGNRFGHVALIMLRGNTNPALCWDPGFNHLRALGRLDWSVLSGNCQVDDKGCLLSPNFPEKYPGGETCTINVPVLASRRIFNSAFDTEPKWDNLTVNGVAYSGDLGPESIVPRGMIHWSADATQSGDGWELCPDESILCVNALSVSDAFRLAQALGFITVAGWFLGVSVIWLTWIKRMVQSQGQEDSDGDDNILDLAKRIDQLGNELRDHHAMAQAEKFQLFQELGTARPVEPVRGIHRRYRFICKGIYVDLLLVVVDFWLDLATAHTLLLNGDFHFAAILLSMLGATSILEVRSGIWCRLYNEIPGMLQTGLPTEGFLQLLDRERGIEAPISLLICTYALPFAVKTPMQAVTGVLSLFSSSLCLALQMHRKLDLTVRVDGQEVSHTLSAESLLAQAWQRLKSVSSDRQGLDEEEEDDSRSRSSKDEENSDESESRDGAAP